jgi:hypothetical protein
MVRVDISSKEYRPFTFYQDFKIATQFSGYFLTSLQFPTRFISLEFGMGAYGSLQSRFPSSRFNFSISKYIITTASVQSGLGNKASI